MVETKMLDINEDSITGEVIVRNAGCTDARLRELMLALVQHLHAFVRQAKVTTAEWDATLLFLEEVGRHSDASRSEFRLFSDALGVSSLVHLLNGSSGVPTAGVRDTLPINEARQWVELCDLEDTKCFVSGTVKGAEGERIPGAELVILPVDARGLVGVATPNVMPLGIVRCDAHGRFGFCVPPPKPFAFPADGPVARMLRALNRHAWRAAHLHLQIWAQGYVPLDSRVFRSDCEHLSSDASFSLRSHEIADWTLHAPGVAPDGSRMTQPFYTLDRDFVLVRAPAARASPPLPFPSTSQEKSS
ncbi:dioxygenase [Ramlibacter sp. 2FC]|uniref:dioxygenase n=1 Tax=Ramlibacter sp. 2FC TaxID=2502188 RepID=UPI0010F74D09|nr:dioxygenase [Ramlibacter sp. 2FC]